MMKKKGGTMVGSLGFAPLKVPFPVTFPNMAKFFCIANCRIYNMFSTIARSSSLAGK